MKLPDSEQQALLARLRSLEQELLALRRTLAAEATPVPSLPFVALPVRVGGVWYAFSVDAVREVTPVVATRPVAEAPGWVIGSCRYGDRVMPVVDLQARLMGQETALRPEMLMVIGEAPSVTAFVVEDVAMLKHVDTDNWVTLESSLQAPFMVGAILEPDGTTITLLSMEILSRDFVLEC